MSSQSPHKNDSSGVWSIFRNPSQSSNEKDLIDLSEPDKGSTAAGGSREAFESSSTASGNSHADREKGATGENKVDRGSKADYGESKVDRESRTGGGKGAPEEGGAYGKSSSPGSKRAAREPGKETGSRESPHSSSPKRKPGAGSGGVPISHLKKEPDCHMKLGVLKSSNKHTVLIDTNEFPRRIVPYLGHHVWDKDHVKLPVVLPHAEFSESRRKTMHTALHCLTRGGASVGDVVEAIGSYNAGHSREWSFEALYNFVLNTHKHENDFSTLIGKMANLALQLPGLIRHAVPLLKQGQSHSITLSQEQISCLLANAFFCTFPHRNTTKPGSEYINYPTINFSGLFGPYNIRKFQKLRALFHYFNTVTQQETKPEGLVTFERICIDPSQLPEWKKKKETLTKLHVSSEGSIEQDGQGMLQVDFACKFIGGGVLGKGLVQEEIRFIMCPELIVARLFTEKLEDNECLKITGVQRFNACHGYSDSFEWVGPYDDKTGRDEWKRRYCQIVAIDALSFSAPGEQFTKKNIQRELNKAYVGFKSDTHPDHTPAIATGNWGCGAFNGDARLKALIQMMAAAVAKRDLAFFTFGNEQQADDMQLIHKVLTDKKVTVDKLYELLNKYCDYYNRHAPRVKNVFKYVTDEVGCPHKL